MNRPTGTPVRAAKHAVRLRGPYGFVAAGAAISVALATTAGAAKFRLPVLVALAAGALVGVLAVAALPSVPKRLATPFALVSGGFVLVRYAQAGAVSVAFAIAWGIVTVATLIALEHAEHGELRALTGTPAAASGVVRTALMGVAAVVGLSLVLWPLFDFAGARAARGNTADPFSSSTPNLDDAGVMDTRSRPRLSDAVVMKVSADRPAFWRGTVFDTWDGRVWTRSDQRDPAPLLTNGRDDRVIVPAGAGARIGPHRVNEQTFEIVADYAAIVFAAPEAVEVESDHLVAARADGTVIAGFDPFGAGARYTVRSHEPDATEVSLRAATGPVPEDIAGRYAEPVEATSARIRSLARRITADAPTNYDKVRAIEAWLGANVEYSLEAPLPPASVEDSVDWFVFEGRAGWCEQIASTLVVMLREVGIPARIATGFVTGSHDPVTGRYTVRERDAHAWAEVWFPGIGWQGFDPTASVPLAGESPQVDSLFSWLQRNTVVVALAFVLAGAVVFAGRSISRRWARRRGPRPAWAARALADLERIGERSGRARAASETPRRFAAALAAQLDEPALVQVGEVIDREGYGARGGDRDGEDMEVVPGGDRHDGGMRDEARSTLTRLLG